jgi:hypothetical protein
MLQYTEKNIYESFYNAYKTRIKDLFKEKKDFDIVTSFNGEITKADNYMEIINKTQDYEFIQLCALLFPNNFTTDQNSQHLILKEFKIRTIEFTRDQKIACRKFVEFVMNKNKKTFGLYGFSGTGKTTTLIEIVSYLIENKLIKSIAFSAPTNKAVNVMKNKFEKHIKNLYELFSGKKYEEEILFDDILYKLYEYGVNIQFMTIHKLLNFDFDFDNDGKLYFKKSNESEVWNYNLVVIDECSMLPAQMVDIIFTEIRTNKRETKIVFSGDIAQLPPVNEKNSIIFTKKDEDFPFDSYLSCFGVGEEEAIKTTCLKLKYDQLMGDIISMDYFVMKQIVRSKSNNVLGVCNTIRDWALEDMDKFKIGRFIDSIDCNAYKYIKFTKKTSSDWFKRFIEQTKNKKDSIILTWTNKQCDEYNNEIRKILFNNEKLESYVVGDILMLGDFYNMKQDKEDEGNKFYTSEQIQIINVEIIEKQIEAFPYTLNKKSQKLENAKIYEEYYKKTLDKINSSVKKTYKCWKLYVKRLSCRDEQQCIIYVIHKDYEKVHEIEQEFIGNCIRKLRTKLISKYRDKTSVIDNHIIKYFWKLFHASYIQPFANVNYGYCITCHKAQGSTFYNVFVDMEDIVKNLNDNEMRRCLYTAVSRTSNELHILV